MPPLRCHQSKKEAVFQLCNFICPQSVCEIKDLADGEILFKTIQTRLPAFSEVEVESSDDNIKSETSDIFLQHIKKFIDDHYNIQSEKIIEYQKLATFDEIEILKLTIFVLSEIIKYLHEIGSEDLINLFHMDIKFQVELEDIFKLFITERDSLSKSSIERFLSKMSKKATTFSTPKRTSPRYRDQLESTPKEDVFTNSPLKTYFESPAFKKEDVLMKEKIIKCFEKTLAEGDEQVEEFQSKITKLENDLKNKEKDIKCLQKKLDAKEEENEVLIRDIESLKAKEESLSEEVTTRKHECEILKYRVLELSTQVEELQKIIKEEEPNRRRSSSQLHESSLLKSKEEEFNYVKRRSSSQLQLLESSLLNSKEQEIRMLKEKMKELESKIISYKSELAKKLLAEIKIEPPGARNKSYEEAWFDCNIDIQEKAQLLSTIIVADNKDLSAKLTRAESENQRLLNEIENLKMKLAGKKQKSRSTELKDTSKAPETERLRKSYDETSSILNNSDYPSPFEDSTSSEPKALPCSEKSPGAVLWKMYDSQKSEIENTYDINLNHESELPENSNLDLTNDMQLSQIKIKNIEPNSSANQENNNVLGNLNFNGFFNELKKLTKNGSFQKVLQVFGQRQKEINGTNGCNRLDLQEMLQMITECLCLVSELNAGAVLDNRSDKCCSTDDKQLCTVTELNIQLDKLKNQLSDEIQKREIELKAYNSELQELKQEKVKLENKYQTSTQVISEKKKTIEEIYRKYKEQILKMEHLNRKYFELKKSYEVLFDEKKQQQVENSEIRKISLAVCKKKRYYEKLLKLSQEENTKLRAELQKLKEENQMLLKEKESWSHGSALEFRRSSVGVPNHLSIKQETFSQEMANESALSSAFYKNASYYVSENEDDFCYYNSLKSIHKEHEDSRVEEIKRRNSLYPSQLQSSYPLEMDLNTTYHSLYVQDKCLEQQQHSKKRKLAAVELEMPSHCVVRTPVKKVKKEFVTPPSLRKLLERKRKPISFISKSRP